MDAAGSPVVPKLLRRIQLLPFFRDLPPREVGMQACAKAVRRISVASCTFLTSYRRYVRSSRVSLMARPGLRKVRLSFVAQFSIFAEVAINIERCAKAAPYRRCGEIVPGWRSNLREKDAVWMSFGVLEHALCA